MLQDRRLRPEPRRPARLGDGPVRGPASASRAPTGSPRRPTRRTSTRRASSARTTTQSGQDRLLRQLRPVELRAASASPRAATPRATRSPPTSRRTPGDTVFTQQVFVIKRDMRLRENFTGFLLDVQEPLQSLHAQRGDMLDLDVHELTIGARGSARLHGEAFGQRQELELGYFARGDDADGTQQRLEAVDRRPLQDRHRPRLEARRHRPLRRRQPAPVAWLDVCAAACAARSSPTTSSTTARRRPSRTRRRPTRPSTRAASPSRTSAARASPTRDVDLERGVPAARLAARSAVPRLHALRQLRARRSLGRSQLHHPGRRRRRSPASPRTRRAPATRAACANTVVVARSVLFQTVVDQRSDLRARPRAATSSASGTTRTGWLGALRLDRQLLRRVGEPDAGPRDVQRHRRSRSPTCRASSCARTRRSSATLPWPLRGQAVPRAARRRHHLRRAAAAAVRPVSERHLHHRRLGLARLVAATRSRLVCDQPARHAVPPRRVQLRLRLPQPAAADAGPRADVHRGRAARAFATFGVNFGGV